MRKSHKGPSGAFQAADGRWVSADWKWWWDGQGWQPLSPGDRLRLSDPVESERIDRRFARFRTAATEYDAATGDVDDGDPASLARVVSTGLELVSADLQLLETALDELVIDIAAGLPSDFLISSIQSRKQEVTNAREYVDETAQFAAHPLEAILTDEDEADDS